MRLGQADVYERNQGFFLGFTSHVKCDEAWAS
jgi:hypothetical protein